MNTAIIGLGSNISPRKNIAQAVHLLSREFHLLKKSKFIKTRPIGLLGAKDFLNGAILIETALDSATLKQTLKNIEQRLGRPRQHRKNESRIIDLDILVFNHKIIDPNVPRRKFLKQALKEINSKLFLAKKSLS